jgi:hypothetical protein
MIARFRQFISRITAFLRSAEMDQDFNEELESHLAMLVEDYMARGLSPEQALRRAQIVLGGRAQLLEAHRAARGLQFPDAVLRDLRQGLGILREHPMLALTAIILFCLRHHGRQDRRVAVILLCVFAIGRYIVAAQRASGQGKQIPPDAGGG